MFGLQLQSHIKNRKKKILGQILWNKPQQQKIICDLHHYFQKAPHLDFFFFIRWAKVGHFEITVLKEIRIESF